jgi:glycerophosphoryl diester phosphodiesterase
MTPVIIAHRGASYLAEYENTLDAFQLAIDIGADYVEFDVRRTKDKKLIVVHDADFDGTLYSDLSYDEICALTEPLNYTIPLLIDVLKLCQGRIKLDIELKEGGYEKQVVMLVRDMFHYDQFMMKSFDDNVVARIKLIDPDIKAGLLIGMESADAKRRFNEYFPERRLKLCNADFVSPYYSLATREFIHRMRRHNKEVYIWTVNGIKNLEKYVRAKPDGIITDMPDGALYVRRDYI